ncbi:hypothetical protein ASE11_06670 [Hydrogenophaga sp. Root209]|uniref:hypothetical protein n=1 Tax=Hydrogenophaga sp. Root209 TaxID=1736490 RepID=UPI0006F4A237|nr:hypothetical protein [Hydrogenophaga sp. Root209]KRC01291.1 hypothetical protein ASE11_06670 [Hydrogenophaga sp. Root209]
MPQAILAVPIADTLMLRNKNAVRSRWVATRRINVIETLGATTVFCRDKTGTHCCPPLLQYDQLHWVERGRPSWWGPYHYQVRDGLNQALRSLPSPAVPQLIP